MDQVRKREDSQLEAVWLAAGADVLAACWKCGAVGSMLFERWRTWVFFALIVLLLVIIFMSLYGSTTPSPSECDTKVEHNKRERKTRDKQSRDTVIDYEGSKLFEKSSESKRSTKLEIAEDDKRAKTSDLSLSREELNERVKAFIAMFKQHLI